MAEQLTARQREVYQYLLDRERHGQPPPTYREIAARFGMVSPNGARVHIVTLERKGWVRVDSLKARGIRILHRPARWSLPLLGRIVDGRFVPSGQH